MAQQTNPFDQFDAAPVAGGYQVILPESPVVRAKDSADLTNAQLSGRRTEQSIRLDAEAAARQRAEQDRQRTALIADLYTKGLRIGANGQPEPIPNWKDPKKATPAQMVDPAAGLQRAINDMKARFAEGPGSTRGIAGLSDFLPSQSNKAFDKAASAARGYVGPALGLTASQLNSPGEIEAAIGPYIPTSSDYDANIRAAFDRLQGLANDQRKRAGFTGAVEGSQPQQQQNAPMLAAGSGPTSNPPPPPSGPAGYDVAGVAGGVSGGPGGAGSTFANAAGVAMATKLKDAYNKGAGVQELNSLLVNNGFQPFSDPAAIEAISKRGALNFAPPAVADNRSGLDRAIGAAADSPLGAYAINAGDALTAGTLDNMAGGNAKLAQEYVGQQYPGASLLGTVTGGALASAGTELGLGAAAGRAGLSAASPWVARAGDALYGAAYGAGSADGGNRLLGGLAGGVGGYAGGVAGRAAARGIGGALTGVEDASVRTLRDNKVPTTVGQTLGGTARRIENAMTSIPGVGDIINNRYREGIAALRPAAVRQAVDGVPANITATTGREALEQGNAAVGNAYDSALNGVDLTIDPGYKREVGSALQSANTLPGPLRDTFMSTLQNRVAPQFNGQRIDGRGLQAAVQGLRKDSGALISRNEVQSDLFANRAGDIEEALFNMAERQAPGTPEALQAANRANRGMSIISDASARAMNNGGDFTANQLGQAIKQNSRRFNGMRALGSGKAPLQALQEAAQNVLPSVVPDSGTTGRALVAAGLGTVGLGGVGAGGGYAAGGGDAAGTGAGLGLGGAALLALAGTKGGQKALTAALLNRTTADQIVGRAIKNRAGRAGIFGAPLLASGGSYLATQ